MRCKNCGVEIEEKNGEYLDQKYIYPKLCGTNGKELHEPEDLELDPTFIMDESGHLKIIEISIITKASQK